MPFITSDPVLVFISVLAIAAGLLAIVAVTVRFVPAFAGFRYQLSDASLPLAAVIAVSATASSLWFSEHLMFLPCKMCWYQRIGMYSLALILTIAAFKKDQNIRLYALVLSLVGAGFSTFHTMIEWFPSLESSTSCDVNNPCSFVYFRNFGFLSIPTGALFCFLAIAALMTLNPQKLDDLDATDDETDDELSEDFGADVG